MSDDGFLTSKGKSVTLNDPDNLPRDVSYFTFRLSLNPHTVDPRAPNTVHQFEPLRLPHNSPSSTVKLSFSIPSVVTNQLSIAIFDATFRELLDNLLNRMIATQMRDILSARRDSLSTSVPSTVSCFQPKFVNHDSSSHFDSKNRHGPLPFFCRFYLYRTPRFFG